MDREMFTTRLLSLAVSVLVCLALVSGSLTNDTLTASVAAGPGLNLVPPPVDAENASSQNLPAVDSSSLTADNDQDGTLSGTSWAGLNSLSLMPVDETGNSSSVPPSLMTDVLVGDERQRFDAGLSPASAASLNASGDTVEPAGVQSVPSRPAAQSQVGNDALRPLPAFPFLSSMGNVQLAGDTPVVDGPWNEEKVNTSALSISLMDSAPSFGFDIPRTNTVEKPTNASAIDGSLCGLEPVFSCHGRCGQLQDAPCSCHPQCLIYKTCCRDFELECPGSRMYLSDFERQFLNAGIECPDRYHWPVIASCPTDADPETVKRCRTPQATSVHRYHAGGATSMGDIIPVTHTLSGLHFKNMHCARCNGVTDFLLPWSGMFLCSHSPTSMEKLFSEVINGRMVGIFCPILWDVPVGYHHTPCLPTSKLGDSSFCPNLTMYDLCEADQTVGYVTATSFSTGESEVFKNRFCLMCAAEERSFHHCHPTSASELVRDRNYYNSMHVDWDDDNKMWVFTGVDSRYPMAISLAVCSPGEDGSPTDCEIRNCSVYNTLTNDTCRWNYPVTHTILVKIRLPTTDGNGQAVDVAELLELLGDSLQNFTTVAVASETTIESSVVLETGGWFLAIRAFSIFSVYRHRIWMVTSALENHAVDLASERQIPFLWFCTRVLMYHARYDHNCTYTKNHTIWTVRHGQSPLGPSLSPGSVASVRTSGEAESLADEAWTWRTYLSVVCISLSMAGLSLRVLAQPFLSFFHTYASKLQFFLCLSLLLAYLVFMVGGFPDAGSWLCRAAAVATHWAFLSAMLWMNVNAVQIWRVFRPSNWSRASLQSKVHLGCHVYAWLGPVVLVGPPVIVDHIYPSAALAPRYGLVQCWFNNGHALLLFFIGPTVLISVANLVLTIIVTYFVHTQKMQYEDAASSVWMEATACLKLVVLVGVTWLLCIPATIFNQPILGDIFTLANATLGLLITLAIMANRVFLRGVRDQFQRKSEKNQGQPHGQQTKVSVVSTRISDDGTGEKRPTQD